MVKRAAASEDALLGVGDTLAASSGTAVEENAGEAIQIPQVRSDSISGTSVMLHSQGLLAYIAGQVLPFQSNEPEVEEVVDQELVEGYSASDDDPIQPRFDMNE